MSNGDGGVGYFAPGATDDWLYGSRGVPSYTFEIGPDSGPCAGFFPAYTCMTSTFWPQQEPVLRSAAQAAATPYGPFPTTQRTHRPWHPAARARSTDQ